MRHLIQHESALFTTDSAKDKDFQFPITRVSFPDIRIWSIFFVIRMPCDDSLLRNIGKISCKPKFSICRRENNSLSPK
ncbi:hypothetical protein CWN56_28490 [Klebsiella pneumoniae]|nr:hypothetical protein CWN56_28490 [Klebsiella pneumoniae]